MSLTVIPIGQLQDNDSLDLCIPLALCRVSAGFPSPADDHMEKDLNILRQLVPRPSTTFFVRASGDSMVNTGIYDGDLLIVDRSMEAQFGEVVVVSLNGEMTVKTLGKIKGEPYLIPQNKRYPPLPLRGHECHVWGVVTYNIKAQSSRVWH